MSRPGWDVPGDPLPESRWFAPTDRCPHPERWTATDGDSTEREVSELIAALVRALQPDLVVESGAAFGGTTRMVAAALSRNGHGRLVALEPDPERAKLARAACHFTDVDGRVEVVEAASLDWTPPGPVDMLFSDSLRELRCDEILRWLPWLRPGAIVAVHDSAWDMGPLRGWLENSLVKPGLCRAIDLPTPRGLTLLEVLATP